MSHTPAAQWAQRPPPSLARSGTIERAGSPEEPQRRRTREAIAHARSILQRRAGLKQQGAERSAAGSADAAVQTPDMVSVTDTGVVEETAETAETMAPSARRGRAARRVVFEENDETTSAAAATDNSVIHRDAPDFASATTFSHRTDSRATPQRQVAAAPTRLDQPSASSRLVLQQLAATLDAMVAEENAIRHFWGTAQGPDTLLRPRASSPPPAHAVWAPDAILALASAPVRMQFCFQPRFTSLCFAPRVLYGPFPFLRFNYQPFVGGSHLTL